ncbi:MAG: hypothetical protein AB7U24_06645 [Sulfurimonadaceae bacterium]
MKKIIATVMFMACTLLFGYEPITQQEIDAWEKVGVMHAENIEFWKNSKIAKTPQEFQRWKDLGVWASEIEFWERSGAVESVDEAALWHEVDVKSYHDIKKYKQQNLSIAQIKEWNAIGIKTEDIQNWQYSDIKTYQEAKPWRDAGIGFGYVRYYKQFNMTPQEVKFWITGGIEHPQDIRDLKNAGFTSPKEYMPYKAFSKEKALKLKEWGIKPTKQVELLAKRNDFGVRDIFFSSKERLQEGLKSLKKCDTIEDIYFSQTDPYANEGKCYMFVGTMKQRLDKSSALIEGARNYFYASFNGAWANNATKVGVVIGEGDFSYTTSDNRKNVIPKGKVLFLQ